MTEPSWVQHPTVRLVEAVASDQTVVRAARVSVVGAESLDTAQDNAGLIEFLMRNRHGTPFEHNSFTFLVTAPIFVWREHHRHRIGFSYNEESGRYKQLEPVFYEPGPGRALTQVGKPGHYTYVDAPELYDDVQRRIQHANTEAYNAYERMLETGVAREVARMVLPVNIMSSCYVTCNARSLMAFLSLRTKDESSTFASFPQREIEMVAVEYESFFAELMPQTHAAFAKHGRVAP